MGLRCLIGHDYGEPQVERDRDEQGDEVVVTIEEFRECSRCGHRRTVSENKEITTLSPPETDSADDGDSPDGDGATSDAVADRPGPDTYDDVSAEDDDGVILEEESPTEPERGHGEWPAADVNRTQAESDEPAQEATAGPDGTAVAAGAPPSPRDNGSTGPAGEGTTTADAGVTESAGDTRIATDDDPEPWPSVSEDADEGFDAEPSDGSSATDAFEDDYSTATRDDAGGAQTEELVEPAAPGRGSAASGIESETPGPSPGRQQRLEGETEFVCPACDHRQAAAGSSLRPGDICPECRSGYISERER